MIEVLSENNITLTVLLVTIKNKMGLFSVVCLSIFGIAIIIAVTYGQNPSSSKGVEELRIKKKFDHNFSIDISICS